MHSSTQLYAERVLEQNISDEELTEILDAKYEMLNELGINQHHDAVTGTGKQAVADDYAYRLMNATAQNDVPYSKAISNKITKLAVSPLIPGSSAARLTPLILTAPPVNSLCQTQP
jgi:hypothetical protein